MSDQGKTNRFDYIGQAYRQGASVLDIVSFCASAGDVRRWGGVPAKTERFHGGFQRALGARYQNIKKYFDDSQISPTSIVVAFRQGALKLSPLSFPESWLDSKRLKHVPNFVHVSFEVDVIDADTVTLDELRSRVRAMLKPRLDESRQAIGEVEESPDEQTLDGDSAEADREDDAESDGEEGEDEAELDVGHSKLKQFFDFISDAEQINVWLANENARYSETRAKDKTTQKEKDFLTSTPEERLKALLISLLRPAMIVDGQHRVWGADNSDKAPIVFNVCAVKDADWVEQVFQFVVINKLAKPISPGFLTSILNTSLTNAEVKEIEERLEAIGIRNTERKIMKYLNLDERSPFCGRIGEPGEVAGVDNKGKLSDKGMIRLARRWLNIKNEKKEIEMFRTALGAKKLGEAKKKWNQYAVWIPFFYSFWTTIRDKYEKDGLWEKRDGSHLFYIVTMHVMQDMFIKNKSKADSHFGSLEDFADQVGKYFEDVSPTFFQQWEATGLQSGEGPQWIEEAIEDLRAGKRVGTVKDESPLFKKIPRTA